MDCGFTSEKVVGIWRLAKYPLGMAKFSRAKLCHYRAKIMLVYDGDTCKADVDFGFKVVVSGEKIRLA